MEKILVSPIDTAHLAWLGAVETASSPKALGSPGCSEQAGPVLHPLDIHSRLFQQEQMHNKLKH